ncbi:hypothetical protein NT01EI_3084 [Edwardsiella ictaluri 93-146]|uniref:Uncharacterized protein n=1 Tax=Edwardsiella ictaluri (strain 93-146) TaxID=634503 RepID=C5BAM7_EDWI9|nr:hypothetical protein NT01EI_3084 [Edwardsiella ictaluri 93-146]
MLSLLPNFIFKIMFNIFMSVFECPFARKWFDAARCDFLFHGGTLMKIICCVSS